MRGIPAIKLMIDREAFVRYNIKALANIRESALNASIHSPRYRSVQLLFPVQRRGVAQFGRVLGLGPRCRRFESCRLDHKKTNLLKTGLSFCLFTNS